MNRRLLVIATTLVALLWGGALAQEAALSQRDDSLLQRYDLAIENLEIAVASVPQDGAQARDELERALNALLTLSSNASSPSLVQAMERTFDRTRVTIDNQSRTDMAVQTGVLAGGFARLVMDSAFAAAVDGDLDLARARLLHLAVDLAFTPEAQQELQAAGSTSALRLAFEAGAAESIAAELREADALLDADVAAAYERLAGAYGASLLVQDSPRVSPELNRYLVTAAEALVQADAATAREALAGADDALTALAAAARSDAPAADTDAGAAGPVPTELPDLDGVATTAPAEAEPGTAPAEAADADAEVTDADPAATPSAPADAGQAADAEPAPPLAAGPDLEAAVAQRLAALEEERRAETLAAIGRELTLAGVPAQVAQADAEQVLEAGYGSLAAAVGALETQAARAVAAQRTGDVTGARAALVELRSAYHAVLAPLMRSVDVEVAAGAEDLLATVTERADLSSHDVSLVAAQVGAVRRALLGGAAPAAQAFELSVDSFWSNLTRPLVMILLGVLAIVPLVLLNLAFGGSNRNWRLVGWSLFLLLVPVFYEALAAVGALLSSVVDQPWLTALAGWSMFTSNAGQVAWALLVLVALVLAIVGFYGICVQFGLIGGGRRRDAVAATGAAEVHRPTGNTTLDWDEEF